MTYNAAKRIALVVDAEEDVVRMLNIDSQTTTGTITLPSDAEAMGIAANADGSLAAVALTGKNSVALIDVGQKKVSSVVSVGFLPGDMAFWGTDLLVTNAGNGTISIINAATAQVTGAIETGFGPASIDVAGNTAVVTNMQGGSLSLIDLATKKVTTVALERGTRPRDVALTADGKAATPTESAKAAGAKAEALITCLATEGTENSEKYGIIS